MHQRPFSPITSPADRSTQAASGQLQQRILSLVLVPGISAVDGATVGGGDIAHQQGWPEGIVDQQSANARVRGLPGAFLNVPVGRNVASTTWQLGLLQLVRTANREFSSGDVHLEFSINLSVYGASQVSETARRRYRQTQSSYRRLPSYSRDQHLVILPAPHRSRNLWTRVWTDARWSHHLLVGSRKNK